MIFRLRRISFFSLKMVLSAVIIADHRRSAIGISAEKGADKHQYIHDDGNSGNSVFADIFQHGPVKDKSSDSCHQSGCHFRTAISYWFFSVLGKTIYRVLQSAA